MLRLTGGTLRGQLIRSPSDQRTRPSHSRLRQALFNSIQAHIEGSRVLDLFAGSGALGFEAISRGASEVVFVEEAKSAAQWIEKNADSLHVTDQIETIRDSVDRSYGRLRVKGPFDLVLADPPYAEGWELRLLNEFPWEPLLKPEGLFCLEWGRQKSQVSELPDHFPFLVKIREKNYGDSMLTTYQRVEGSQIA